MGVQQLTLNVRMTGSWLPHISLLYHSFSEDVFFTTCPPDKLLFFLVTLGQYARPENHSASGPALPQLDPLSTFCILWTPVSQCPEESLPNTISHTVVLSLFFAVSYSPRLMRYLRTQVISVGELLKHLGGKEHLCFWTSSQKWPNRVTCLFLFSFLR